MRTSGNKNQTVSIERAEKEREGERENKVTFENVDIRAECIHVFCLRVSPTSKRQRRQRQRQ